MSSTRLIPSMILSVVLGAVVVAPTFAAPRPQAASAPKLGAKAPVIEMIGNAYCEEIGTPSVPVNGNPAMAANTAPVVTKIAASVEELPVRLARTNNAAAVTTSRAR